MYKEYELEKMVKEAEENAVIIGAVSLMTLVSGLWYASGHKKRKKKREIKKLRKHIAREMGISPSDIEMVEVTW